jgi:putative ABC transport system permease protein
VICVVLGSCLYRFVISLALRLNVPTEAFKLVSAIIVAVAIAASQVKAKWEFRRKQMAAIQMRKGGR